MSTIKIGSDERNLEDADPQWITHEIQARRADGQSVCIIVAINTGELNLRLATPTCGSGGGGGRPPTAREKSILDLWNERGLNQSDFSPGDVIAFVKQVQRYI